MASTFGLVIAFAAAAAAQGVGSKDAAEKATDPMDKVICKHFIETGSLVKGTRVCKTKREWEQSRDAARSSAMQSGACNTSSGGLC